MNRINKQSVKLYYYYYSRSKMKRLIVESAVHIMMFTLAICGTVDLNSVQSTCRAFFSRQWLGPQPRTTCEAPPSSVLACRRTPPAQSGWRGWPELCQSPSPPPHPCPCSHLARHLCPERWREGRRGEGGRGGRGEGGRGECFHNLLTRVLS